MTNDYKYKPISGPIRKPSLPSYQVTADFCAVCRLNYNYSTIISNGNRTEWSPIRSVIIRVIMLTKSDDRAAGVRFVNQEYDYRPNWTTRSSVTN